MARRVKANPSPPEAASSVLGKSSRGQNGPPAPSEVAVPPAGAGCLFVAPAMQFVAKWFRDSDDENYNHGIQDVADMQQSSNLAQPTDAVKHMGLARESSNSTLTVQSTAMSDALT